ncbi:hypothetical protein HY029_00070 [Candidatus Gottesmanbacteria bacterium]|nr:hypothetical protein [Candidatus Gottesmanbacteria bacterium]
MLEAHVELGHPFDKKSHSNHRPLQIGANTLYEYQPPVSIDLGADGSVTIFHDSLTTPKHESMGGRGRSQFNVHITASVPNLDNQSKGRDFSVVVKQ